MLSLLVFVSILCRNGSVCSAFDELPVAELTTIQYEFIFMFCYPIDTDPKLMNTLDQIT